MLPSPDNMMLAIMAPSQGLLVYTQTGDQLADEQSWTRAVVASDLVPDCIWSQDSSQLLYQTLTKVGCIKVCLCCNPLQHKLVQLLTLSHEMRTSTQWCAADLPQTILSGRQSTSSHAHVCCWQQCQLLQAAACQTCHNFRYSNCRLSCCCWCLRAPPFHNSGLQSRLHDRHQHVQLRMMMSKRVLGAMQ